MRIVFGRLLGDAAGFVLVTVLLLAGVEVAARFLVARETARDALRLVEGVDAVSQTLAWLDINVSPLDRDVDFLWRNRPNVNKRQPVNPEPFGRPAEWTIITNVRGFRSAAPPPPEKGDGELRILCVGDSVTFGFNVDQPDSFPERLQAALRARYPGRPVTVINGGTPGWSWVQGVRFLQREGLSLHPDIVVMAHGANDRFFLSKITDVERLGALERPGARGVESVGLLLERTSTYRLVQRWFAPRVEGGADLSPACRAQVAKTGKCSRVGLDEIEDAIGAADRLAKGAGAALLVLNLDFQETDAVSAVRSATRREHLPFVDVVARYLDRRAADEATRAQRLGLAPAVVRPPSALRPTGPTPVLFRVLVPPGAASVRVEGRTVMGPSTFASELHDDGREGDEMAADGVWSGRLAVKSGEGPLLYLFLRDGVPEFRSLPPLPSTQGSRRRQVTGETTLPVETFGDLYLMTESMHPNGDGQELVAESVLESLPTLEPFARWSGLQDRTAAEWR